MPKEPRRWATFREGAEYGGFSLATIKRMVSSGALPAYRMSARVVRVDLNDIDALARRIPTANTDDRAAAGLGGGVR